MFEIGRDGDAVFLRIQADLDEQNLPRLSALLETLAVDPAAGLLIDLTACDYMSAAGVRLLVRTNRRYPGNFTVRIGPRGNVRRILDVCGLLRGETFVETVRHERDRPTFGHASGVSVA